MMNLGKFFVFASMLLSLLIPGYNFASQDRIGYQYVEKNQSLPVLAPDFRERQEERLVLHNGLKVLLIHDPLAKKAAFSLCVRSGMLDDPIAFPGLSHLVELTLPVASQKYPSEDRLTQMVLENGGDVFSQTFLDRTVFAFSLESSKLESALDYFSSSLSRPDFSSSVLFRGSKLLDAQFQQLIHNPSWPVELIKQKLARNAHPFSHYFPGNLKSLEGVLRKHVQDWFSENYVSQNMNLVVLSPQNLEDIKEMVLTCFHQIQEASAPQKKNTGPLFSSDNKGLIVQIYQDNLEAGKVILSWEVDPRYLNHAKALNKVLKELLASKANGTLLSLLQKEGYIEDLSSELYQPTPQNLLFELSFQLTKGSESNYQKVVSRCFQAIESLKRIGIPDYLTQELAAMEQVAYQWPIRQNPLQESFKLAYSLLDEDFSSFPEKSLMVTPNQLDPMMFIGFLNDLKPTKVNIFNLQAKTKMARSDLDKEPYTQSEYEISEIAARHLTSLEKVIPLANITPRKANPYVASQQRIKSDVLIQDEEMVLQDNEQAKIFYVGLKDYERPEVFWEFRFISAQTNPQDAKSQILNELLNMAIKRQTLATKHLANQAGMDVMIEPFQEGLRLVVSGYSEKARDLLDELGYQLRSIHISEKDFELDKSVLFNRYRALAYDSPLYQGKNYLDTLLVKNFPSEEDKAKLISTLHYMDFQSFTQGFFKKTRVEGLIMGNQTVEQAKVLSQNFLQFLGSEPYLEKDRTVPEVMIFNPQRGPYSLVKTVEHVDHGLILCFEHGTYEPERYLNIALADQVLNQELVVNFQHKLKIAHKCRVGLHTYDGHLFTLVALESQSLSSRDLLDKLEGFLESFTQSLNLVLNQSRLAEEKTRLSQVLFSTPLTLKEKAQQLSFSLFEQKRSLQDLENEQKNLYSLNLTTLKSTLQKSYSRANKKRLALLIEGILPKQTASYYKVVPSKDRMFQLNRFAKGKKSA